MVLIGHSFKPEQMKDLIWYIILPPLLIPQFGKSLRTRPRMKLRPVHRNWPALLAKIIRLYRELCFAPDWAMNNLLISYPMAAW